MNRIFSIVIVLAVLFMGGVLAGAQERSAAESKAIETLKNLGVKVTLDEKSPGKPVVEVELSLSTDDENPGIKEIKTFPHLQRLFVDVLITDAGMRELEGLKELELLFINWTLREPALTDVGMKSVGNLRSLRQLTVFGPGIGAKDPSLKEISRLRELRVLRFSWGQLSDASLRHVAGLEKLEELELNSLEGFTDESVKELKPLKDLRVLRLRGSAGKGGITDVALKELKTMTNLRSLSLAFSEEMAITDAGLSELKGLGNLETLQLPYCQLTGSGLKELSGLKKLKELDLSGTKVTDAGLDHLKEFKALRTLTLVGTKVTDPGAAALRKALPELKIQLKN